MLRVFLSMSLMIYLVFEAQAKYVPLVYNNDGFKIVPLVERFGEAQNSFKEAKLQYVADAKTDKRGWIGVEIQNVTLEKANELGLSKPLGVYVVNVTKFAPAEQGGILTEDVILSVDGNGFKGMRQFVDMVGKTKIGSEISVKVWRKQREENVTIKVGSYADQVDIRRRAAQAGSVKDMMQLGFMYRDGNIVEQNDDEAFRWFKEAADLGNRRGMTNVAWMYEKGRGTQKDEAQAYSLYGQAAQKGSAYSMNKVGSMLEDGRGTAKNTVEAVKWYRKSAEAGYAFGMHNLALMFEKGRGTAMNFHKSVEWYSKAAKAGHRSAMHNLAVIYNHGKGVGRDPALAAEWMYKALKAKNKFSVDEMTANHNKWTESFRRELQRLLKKHGAFKGRVDGSFEKDTLAAIRKVGGQ